MDHPIMAGHVISSDSQTYEESTTKLQEQLLGRLVLEDKTLTLIVDDSQILVGRTDLKKFTKNDPKLISRSHFTIYRKGSHYVIKDGITSVQDKPSKEGTSLNGKRLNGEATLKNKDKITISDLEITFEVQCRCSC